MSEKVKSTVLEDANLVAFLVMKGHIAIPFIKDGDKSRVAWDVQGDVKKHVDEYYNNALVGIRDFVTHLKEVRSGMYNTKTINVQNRED